MIEVNELDTTVNVNTDDSQAEGARVADALEGTRWARTWDAAPMEGGTIYCEFATPTLGDRKEIMELLDEFV